MITKEMLDNAKEKRLFLGANSNAPSEISFVYEHKVYNRFLSDIDDIEIVNKIMQEFEQVSSNWYIQEESCVYKYAVSNGMDYEMHSDTLIYTHLFFTEEEFYEICEKAQAVLKSNNKWHSDWNVAEYLVQNYPFFFLKWGYTFVCDE